MIAHTVKTLVYYFGFTAYYYVGYFMMRKNKSASIERAYMPIVWEKSNFVNHGCALQGNSRFYLFYFYL